jgi:YegS/Rv2252/BmrU family lipid kinase
MTSVAVVAHRKKTFGGGLDELRRVLAEEGFADPAWYEVPKSRKAPKAARKAVRDGADLLFVWGGDGTVQRCVDAVAGSGVAVAILPAGTANLLATNLGVPADLRAAVEAGLHGERRTIDLGRINGERFAVMAGAGFDGLMMARADGALKDKLGKLAYVWTGARATRMDPRKTRIEVDGKRWFAGQATCVLLGSMGTLTGGLVAFPEARPDDGLLEVGVVTAKSAAQWARVLGRLVAGHPERSPLTRMTRGRKVDVRFDKAVAYELDGGARPARKRLKAAVEPRAITVCVPQRRAR